MIYLEHTYDLDEVATRFIHQLPSKKHTLKQGLSLWTTYVDLISKAIHKSIILARSDQIEENTLPMPWEDLNNKLGRSRINNTAYLHWFHQNYPLVKMLKLGKPGTLTMVEPLANIKLAAASQSAAECFKEMYEEYIDDIDFDWAPIDRRSLSAYIQANENQLNTTTKGQSYVDTLLRNQVWAKTIFLCAEHCENTGYGFAIPQAVNESLFGRKYYKGLNLQNCPKIVRHAALGTCFEYDLNASVFAWKLDVAHRQLGIPLKDLTYTLEYLDSKDKIRERLAKTLPIQSTFDKKLKIIKDVMTAIGFGARISTKNACWYDNSGQLVFTAMSKIIKSPEARQQLFTDPWMQGFANEQVLISKTIFDLTKEHLQGLEFLQNERGNLSQNKVCAYLYQQAERSYINDLTAEAKEQNSLLLVVHDGFYTKVPQKLSRLKEILKQHNPEADINKTNINGYAFDPNIAEHENFIIDEEKKAKQYAISKGYKPRFTEKELEFRRKIIMTNTTIEHYKTSQNEDFNNGCRLENNYNFEDDPFYMED